MNIFSPTITIFYLLTLFATAQDYIIHSHEPASITLNHPKSQSQTYLLEIGSQYFDQNWASFFVHYQSTNADSIVELEFMHVTKQNPSRSGQIIRQCRFNGIDPQWCKINIKRFNIQKDLVKLRLDCLNSCNASLILGLTKTDWDESYSPAIKGKSNELASLNPQKTIILMKIIGWMVLTLFLILGAIQLAVKVANKFDKQVPEQIPYIPNLQKKYN